MKSKFGIISIILASATLFFSGCRRVDNVVWSKYAPLPTEGWDPINVIPFFPWPEDSIANPADRYSLVVSVRFPATKTFAPLHLAIMQEDESGWSASDTVTINLLPPSNTPTGRGTYGVYEAVDTLTRGITLRPGYCVELQTLSVPERTQGLLDIGLILAIEKENQPLLERIKGMFPLKPDSLFYKL
ncbi:MAG: gliding motility lipoprotein GldH [Muribaculaceae bacterium]|nr:gliding motility lipoprotein GldH [Muribaculaceae bacterium]